LTLTKKRTASSGNKIHSPKKAAYMLSESQ
jgi:hypothetical protein